MRAANPSWLATTLLSAGLAVGLPVSTCPPGAGGVCYSIAVPTSSANAGSGNIYFQIKAPATFQWVALGTGSGMAGSNMFLMYQDGTGNLTLSPRLGTQHEMPTLDGSSTAARLTLLAGSGVNGTTMTANVACSNCQTWNGGQMSLASSRTAWIAAWKAGPSLATTDRAAPIVPHDGYAQFSVDLTRATISSDSNPFTATSSADSGSGGGSGSGASSGSGSGITETGGSRGAILAGHGIIMALVMAVLYPVGALLMPLLKKWWVHAAWQSLAFCLMWVGFGLGVATAKERNMLFSQTHTIFGTVIVCLMATQPVLGFLHHRHYLKVQRRGPISYAHIWWGRILMVLAVVCGGTGLKLVGERNSLVIGYSVIVAIVFLAYFLVKGFVVFRSKGKNDRSGQKEADTGIQPPNGPPGNGYEGRYEEPRYA